MASDKTAGSKIKKWERDGERRSREEAKEGRWRAAARSILAAEKSIKAPPYVLAYIERGELYNSQSAAAAAAAGRLI